MTLGNTVPLYRLTAPVQGHVVFNAPSCKGFLFPVEIILAVVLLLGRHHG